ncbi:MAG: IS1595 family transposase [Alphaproteobacteria bacterium]|nr:IS1595 family transposase [Alphaproteobacteria bacterium]MBV9692087.1 IS1595 family transposase [Alphaproteobacteria bacterium]
MAQHFLLSGKARTLSLAAILRMSDEEAYEAFKSIRFADNEGAPFCPKCGAVDLYALPRRKMWRCKAKECGCQFSITSGTIFSSRKLSIRDVLAAIAVFTNGAKGYSALQLSRDLDVQYKTAFVLAHKLREAIAAQDRNAKVSGEVEIDGMYAGGYVKPANHKENRRDRRLARNQNGKRMVVIAARERNGKIVTFVSKTEDQGVEGLENRIEVGSTVYADEASHWDAMHARYETKRINHSLAYSDGEGCTNQVESFFSRLRRAEIGTHHKIAGRYLAAYAAEMDWREDNRRVSNGEQYRAIVTAAARHPVSRQWKGYWQRRAAGGNQAV